MASLTFAANNGAIGGGEVMLLQMAQAARSLGTSVTVVGPGGPDELTQAARAAGFHTVELDADSRPAYLQQLRTWDHRHREGLLWCNGLVPALATAGHPHRVVHLHQVPRGLHSVVTRIARWRSDLVVVPSQYMATQVRGSVVMANWTAKPSPMRRRRHEVGTPARIGFLGRLSQDKGVDILARAVYLLNERDPDSVELVLAGDYRFVSEKQALAVKQAITKIGGQVIELGWIDRDTLFSTIDLAVFPSVWPEPFGLVAAEAMAARLPFVVSDAGALPEVAGAGHPWVAKAGDPESLAAMIGSALNLNPASATQTAYARWGTEYSAEAGKDRMADILRRLGILDLPWSADS